MNGNWHYRMAWLQLALRENLVGIEIGVDKGTNARFMLSNLSIKKLYLVDPYFEQSEEFTPDGERPYIESTPYREAYEIAKRILKPYEDKIEWLIGTTEEVIDKVPDDSLDFCYIDGCHEYKFVKLDIELCLPKVKQFGIIGGHDFVNEHPGVCKAVIEKFGRDNLFVAGRDWWIIIK